MASKTKKTEGVRKRKDCPNKVNMKQCEARLRMNREVLDKVSAAK